MTTVPPPDLATRLVARLVERGQTVATCESLTGGLLGATITSVPGSSAVFRGGLITYATDLKHTLGQVPSETLTEHGAVAEATAVSMAEGARQQCRADWAMAVTGVAGPDAQEGHPAGTVWVAVCGPTGDPTATLHRFAGGRSEVRDLTVTAALATLLGSLG